jgi:hypothetical protein
MNNVEDLFLTKTVRSRANIFLERIRCDQSPYFTLQENQLDTCALFVAEVTKKRYPSLNIPFHSRWRHFEAGGFNRRLWLEDASIHSITLIDLVIVSVLLDAGAGSEWIFFEKETNQSFTRSEGLGIASFHAFKSGLFSSDPKNPLQVDALGLQQLTLEKLANAFQVKDSNPLIGLMGRLEILHRLGQVLANHEDIFGTNGRPGNLYNYVLSSKKSIRAHQLLTLLLNIFSPIWPSGQNLNGKYLGDCWYHSALGDAIDSPESWMPFHKLSQWLTYSLLEPFIWNNISITGLEELTALPEYRNGGLLIDQKILLLKKPINRLVWYRPNSELIIEWRALTIALIDLLAPRVRNFLNCSEEKMPLACILEGGTWAAGRELAFQLHGGEPPIKIHSEGTVF